MSEATYTRLTTFFIGLAIGCLLLTGNMPEVAGFFFVGFLLSSAAFLGLTAWWNHWRRTPTSKPE